MSMLAAFRARVRRLKGEIRALYWAARHPDTPWYAKAFIACVLAYALSPIDLIPDFVPVLGLLDDIVLVPLGLVVAVRMIPAQVMTECRARAHGGPDLPANRIAAALVVAAWLLLAVLFARWALDAIAPAG
jgi:uncharacterized membrane protein YkvA (DUF1232 family)